MQSGGRIYVSDTFNDRVLSWPSAAAFTIGQAADLVIGQANFTSDGCNRGGAPAANTLCDPEGLFVDPNGNLYVADSSNNRVLIFNVPASTDTVADMVLGQAGFSVGSCNRGGGASSVTLCSPSDVAVDRDGNVYVADTSNHRVLRFNSPLSAGADTVADKVFGHATFSGQACNRNGTLKDDTFCSPQGLGLRPGLGGPLYVADTANDRVLAFNAPFSGDIKADQVLGQANFTTSHCNRDLEPSLVTLCQPYDVVVDRIGNVFVADRNNSRVLQYDNPGTLGTTADRILGQTGFDNFTCNRGESAFAASLCNPQGVAVDNAGDVYVADTGNNRVLAFDSPSVQPLPAGRR